MARLNGKGKFIICLLVVAAVWGIYALNQKTKFLDNLAPQGKQAENITPDLMKNAGGGGNGGGSASGTINVGINTWCGFAGLVYWNKGMKVNSDSNFAKDGLSVNISQADDFTAGKDAWKAGKYDVWYATADSFPVDVDGVKSLLPKIIMQSDWSFGGDCIVVRPGINTVSDLKGKTVAYAEGSPSHTFLLWMLSANDMSSNEIKPVKVANGIDAAAAFKANKVDAAVCWAPDDQDCVTAIPGSKVLINTKKASNIIADVIYVKDSFAQAHPKEIQALIKGWLSANAEINSSKVARKEAAKLFAAGFGVSEQFAYEGIGNARLCTYGDNLNFFGLNPAYTGVTGDSLYSKMCDVYNKIGLAPATLPNWRVINDSSYLRSVNLIVEGQEAQGQVKFSPVEDPDSLKTISSKKVSITFATGSAVLDQNAKYVVQLGFGDYVKSFANARIRIEGNTDNVGSDAINISLSKRRAQAVASWLISAYKCDPNRLVITGNGSSKPVASNDTEDGKAQNRRTDFEIVE